MILIAVHYGHQKDVQRNVGAVSPADAIHSSLSWPDDICVRDEGIIYDACRDDGDLCSVDRRLCR